ncbi:two component transcriptional regulator, LuxR family [Treponema primitia ZAS-2]|uniref:Two component transcriptional regulator, LuxR family n=1 Tax=Treponema primitia (strain ATCC BAA-887 / DSM 12427 / ZAS-2) TaxID=545694 RepID=F5YLR6_TREPZ|nr:response regulator transcription factor [Treponema primitia]AEF85663.1 two component transcriptional regulator, LuxR family [Treponema primitia ZAS-2]
MKTLVLIEDHDMMRRGLASYFSQQKRWEVVGEAATLDEASALFETLVKTGVPLPDIVLLDIDLNGAWGLDLVPKLREWYGKKPPVLVYSVFDDYAHVKAATRAGVAGYVCKSQREAELETAMDTILQGDIYFTPYLFPKISAVSDITIFLTKRERQIFELVQRLYSNDRIAGELGINIRTVENKLSIIYDKIGVKSRGELEKL